MHRQWYTQSLGSCQFLEFMEFPEMTEALKAGGRRAEFNGGSVSRSKAVAIPLFTLTVV